MNLVDAVRQSLTTLKHPEGLQDVRIQAQIVQYLMLIEKWNRHYNLTAIKTVEAMLVQHVMDCLAAIEYLNGPRIVDVGTGAGLPGILIAIARPDWQVILVESNQKKTAFLQQVKIELALGNIAIVAQRIENVMINEAIDTVISRAYTSLGHFITSTQHLAGTHNNRCRWIAMKGNCTQQELDEVINPFVIEKKIPLTVPGLLAKRELIIIGRMNFSA